MVNSLKFVLPRLLFGALFLLLSEKSYAGLRLIDENTSEKYFTVTLALTEDSIPSNNPDLVDFRAIPELELLTPEGWVQPSPSPRYSALISLPGTLSSSKLLDHSCSISPLSYANAVEVDLVQAGPFGGLQVTLDPTTLATLQKPLQFTLSIDRTALNPTKSTSEPIVDEWGLFLNSQPLSLSKRIPIESSNSVKSATLPVALGTHRSSYRVGERLASIQVPDDWTTDSVKLVQGQTILPIIGWSNQTALVYLPKRRNIVSDRHDSLFLSENVSNPSELMIERDAFINLTPQNLEVAIPRKRLYADNLIYERATPLPIGERFVQYRVSRNQTRTIQLPFQDRLASPNVSAVVELLGLNTTINLDPDHYSNLTFAAETTPRAVSWKGRVGYKSAFDFVMNTANYTGQAATVPFIHQVPIISGGPSSDIQNLDSIELSWVGYPRVGTDHRLHLQLEPLDPDALEQHRRITVAGFPLGTDATNLLVLEVGNSTPSVLTNCNFFTDFSGTVGVEFEALPGDQAFLIERRENAAVATAVVESPELPEVSALTKLKGIYVCPASLQTALQPLVSLRGDGFIVLDPQAAYDYYSEGQESAESIRLALADLIASAPAAVNFPAIVLVGDASFDQRDYLGLMTTPQVPTFIDESIDTSFTIENCVDFPYALLFGNDNLVDANVSRLPARSAAELTVMINRIIDQELASSDLTALNRPGIFAYDEVEEILVDRPLWQEKWEQTSRPFQEIVLLSPTGAEEKAQLQSLLQATPRSAAFVFYMGHGNNTIWAGGQLMTSNDATTLNTQGGYPFVVTFTCLNSYYAFPGATTRSLGESWLLAPVGKGGVASVAPCSVDLYDNQRQFALATMNLLAAGTRPQTVGELITRARLKMAIARPDLMLTNREYLLFGDALSPTTVLATDSEMGEWAVLE